ncbi:type VI secretion system contractile sheath small subunit [Desulfatitalea alkaliphila]|uniref:Type VI secretion system contractile sheath small subunit n=1 Tax=Desulfatitalea alkaliphila TaxID=2929485 RepID=A0AA41UQX3_9BACT|nr:type VI secretion system contractile sheath small subunit [Desulfatitalea alkaliphila]MCJ8501793.1 type VI secretion system contractile sheath small subunit [Desulfatitalea alkaliphila]
MAKEGTVAPKERVNIVYRPATGDAKEEVELPLKLLVVGDFTLQADDRMIEEREPTRIDKDNFNDVMRAQNLKIDITAPDKLSDEPDKEMAVSLSFESISDFSPESIARRTPELNKLLELREALSSLKGPMSNRPEFRKKIQEIVTDAATREKLLKELNLDKE